MLLAFLESWSFDILETEESCQSVSLKLECISRLLGVSLPGKSTKPDSLEPLGLSSPLLTASLWSGADAPEPQSSWYLMSE